jgi:ATP-dependent Clp protease adaptor protein ClpS
MSVAAPRRQRRAARPGEGERDRPWNVIVLNDSHNTFEGVAFALAQTLPGVGYDQGLEYANRIHFSGRAVVFSGHRERAELYHQQLGALGLTMAPLQRA